MCGLFGCATLAALHPRERAAQSVWGEKEINICSQATRLDRTHGSNAENQEPRTENLHAGSQFLVLGSGGGCYCVGRCASVAVTCTVCLPRTTVRSSVSPGLWLSIILAKTESSVTGALSIAVMI